MVYRIFVEKREGLSPEAGNLLGDLRGFLEIGRASCRERVLRDV